MSTIGIIDETSTIGIIDETSTIGIIDEGMQGPPGPGYELPVPNESQDGYMLAGSSGEWVLIPPPAGTGDMQSLVYDPLGKQTNAFDIGNHQGILDGGVF